MESLKAGIDRIDRKVEDDFTRLLPVYRESYPTAGNAVRADMDNAILKGSKLVQIHSITKKPKRQRLRTRAYREFASKEEFNDWIDDSYLLIGKAYFYQHNFGSAVENFSYILRKFPEEEIRYEAMVWLIRSYSELERFTEAAELIMSLQTDKQFPKKLEKELARATADMYMKKMEYQEAVKFLDISLKKASSRKVKARLQYILAQLHRETGEKEKSAEAFRRVIRYNPPYKMAFNARINGALMFAETGDTGKLKKELQKMLRETKNQEFRDQIFYALANVFQQEGDTVQAIDHYRKSVTSSVDNTYQLALSSITLADIFFKDLNYHEARAYYDSAMMVIGEDYPDYEKLNMRHASLVRLVDNLVTVEVQDSLQKIANMPEPDRDKLIDNFIAQAREKQRQEELMANAERSERGFYQANEYRFGLGRSDEGAGWYFYNPQTVSYGKAQFQQRWGRRKLEDEWRRSNKAIVSPEDMDEFEELADSTLAKARVDDPLDREFYTQDLPLTDSLMKISHEEIRDALYNAGKIFKSDFSDYPRSAESFEDLNSRYGDNIYLLSSWYDLYDLYELMGDHAKSQVYRDLIISRFPDSNYAKYLQNPNFFVELGAKEDSLNRMYQNTFRDYKAGRYAEVLSKSAVMKQMEPDSLILAKIDFMHSVAQGVLSDMSSFENGLNRYISEFPKSEPTPLASEILALIRDSTLTDYQKLVDMGYLHDEIMNDELLPENSSDEDEFGGKFSFDEELLHYFVILYPRSSGVDINRLKFDIANYNLDHYTKIDFDIEEETLDANNTLLIVRSLGNKEQGLIYFRAIIRQPEVFRTLKDLDYFNFVASSTNFRQILSDKSVNDYLKFFLKNYSRFIRSDFKGDTGPEESPEELMTRAQREDEILREKGKFITVDVPASTSFFSPHVDTTQSFVLAVRDKNMSIRTLLTQFAEFNRTQFKGWNLGQQIKQAGEYQLMIVSGLPGYAEAISYFRNVIMQRVLFRSLGQTTYRNFLITDGNLGKLLEKTDIDSYLEFFRAYYLQQQGRSQPAPAGQPAAPAPESSAVTKSVETARPEYTGPYSASEDKSHYVVIAMPAAGSIKEDVLSSLRNFNQNVFQQPAIQLEEKPLDNLRVLIVVSGFPDHASASGYLKKTLSFQALLTSLAGTTYRTFIISPDNLDIFLVRKNITEYLDFYGQFYNSK